MPSKVDIYANYFPDELNSAVKGFDNKVRRAIIAVLVLRGDLAFMKLANELDISKALLAHHLDLLLDSSLVRNYSQPELKGRFDSFYGMTSLGDAFVDSFKNAFSLRPGSLTISDQFGNSTAAGWSPKTPPAGASGSSLQLVQAPAQNPAQNTSSSALSVPA